MKNLSDIVSNKRTAQNRVLTLAAPLCTGFHRDNCWRAPNQLFNAISAMGGTVAIESANYFDCFGVENMGKRWVLTITACGFTFPAMLTASFSDKPMGERYDLTLTV